jgi:hypothetical protein
MKTTLAAISSGALSPPAIGTGKAGACVTTRDFRIVDMDQSDNVVTTYLLINNHTLSQSTPAASKNNTNAQVLSNGSDNALVDDFVNPLTGCTSWMMQSPTAPTGMSAALSLNELMASKFQQNPAIVPANDPMVVITDNNGAITQSLTKVNAYRAQVGQPAAASLADASGVTYCQQFAQAGIYIAQNKALFQTGTSPAPTMATNLYTFLAQRFSNSFGPVPALGCQTIFGLQNSPVSLTMDGNGIVTAATINTNVLQQILNGQIKASTNTAALASSTVATTAPSAATSAMTTMRTMVRSSANSNAANTATGSSAQSSFAAKFTGKFPGNRGGRSATATAAQTNTAQQTNTQQTTAVGAISSAASSAPVAATATSTTGQFGGFGGWRPSFGGNRGFGGLPDFGAWSGAGVFRKLRAVFGQFK